MKKTFSRLFACAFILTAICTNTALAKDTVSVDWKKPDVTVDASTFGANEETTILVVQDGTTISQAFDDTSKIYHMDQVTASSEGVATFKFKYSGTAPLDIYIGYATMGANDVPLDAVVDESGSGENPPAGTFTYGDVNNDGIVDTSDAVAVINNFLHGTVFTHTVNDEKEEFLYGEIAANVNGDSIVDTSDAVAIINNFLHGTEFSVNNR